MYAQVPYAVRPATRPVSTPAMAQPSPLAPPGMQPKFKVPPPATSSSTGSSEVSEVEEAVFRRLAANIVESGPCNLFYLYRSLQSADLQIVMQRSSMKTFLSASPHFVVDDTSQSVSLADTADTRAYIARVTSDMASASVLKPTEAGDSAVCITDKSGQPVELPIKDKVKVTGSSQTLSSASKPLVPTAAPFVPSGQIVSSGSSYATKNTSASTNGRSMSTASSTLQPKSLSSEWKATVKTADRLAGAPSGDNSGESSLRAEAPAFQSNFRTDGKVTSGNSGAINPDARQFVPSTSQSSDATDVRTETSHLNQDYKDTADDDVEIYGSCSQVVDDYVSDNEYDEEAGDEQFETEEHAVVQGDDEWWTTAESQCCDLCIDKDDQEAICEHCTLGLVARQSGKKMFEIEMLETAVKAAVLLMSVTTSDANERHKVLKDASAVISECQQQQHQYKGADNAVPVVPSIPASVQTYLDMVKDTEQVLNICQQLPGHATAGKATSNSGNGGGVETAGKEVDKATSSATPGLDTNQQAAQSQKQQRLNAIIQALGGATAILNDPASLTLLKHFVDSSTETPMANTAANPLVLGNSLANPLSAGSSLANPLINPLAAGGSWVNPLANPLIAGNPSGSVLGNPLTAYAFAANPFALNSNAYLQQLQSANLLHATASLAGASNLNQNASSMSSASSVLNPFGVGSSGVLSSLSTSNSPQLSLTSVDRPLSTGNDSSQSSLSQQSDSVRSDRSRRTASGVTSQISAPGAKVTKTLSESGDDAGRLSGDSARSSPSIRRKALAMAAPVAPLRATSPAVRGRAAAVASQPAAEAVKQADEEENWDGDDDLMASDPWQLATQKTPAPLTLAPVNPARTSIAQSNASSVSAAQQPGSVWARRAIQVSDGGAPQSKTKAQSKKVNADHTAQAASSGSSNGPVALSSTVVNPDYKFVSLQPPGQSSIVWNDIEENFRSAPVAERPAAKPASNVDNTIQPLLSIATQRKVNGYSGAASKQLTSEDEWQHVSMKTKSSKKTTKEGVTNTNQSAAAVSGSGQAKGAVPYKTVLCTHFQKGSCRNGAQCTFAHGEAEMKAYKQADKDKHADKDKRKTAATEYTNLTGIDAVLYKTVLCTYYKKGHCASGADCKFAHGESELRSAQQMTVCDAFLKGHCKYGDKCVYLHPSVLPQPKRSVALADYMSKLPETEHPAASFASSNASDDGASSYGDDADSGRAVSASHSSSCVICADPMLSSQKHDTLDCGHKFHTGCIRRWLASNRTCPMCRDHALLNDEFPRLGVS